MNSIISFHNPLDKEFVFHWDKQAYAVGPKQTVQYPDFLARHGAKHLVDYIILHSETWGAVGTKRTTDSLTQGREELTALILSHEVKVVQEERKTEGEKVKETVENIDKVELQKPVQEPEKEFEDLEVEKLQPKKRGRPAKS